MFWIINLYIIAQIPEVRFLFQMREKLGNRYNVQFPTELPFKAPGQACTTYKKLLEQRHQLMKRGTRW